MCVLPNIKCSVYCHKSCNAELVASMFRLLDIVVVSISMGTFA